MLTNEQIQTASIGDIFNDAKSLPCIKRVRMENDTYRHNYEDRVRWYICFEATFEDREISVRTFSEDGEDVTKFVRRMYSKFLQTLGLGMPTSAYRAELTYTPES